MFNTETAVCIQTSPRAAQTLSACRMRQTELLQPEYHNVNSFSGTYGNSDCTIDSSNPKYCQHLYNNNAKFDECCQSHPHQESFDEDEDLGDDECDEEEMALYKSACARKTECNINVDFTSQLLQFASMVSTDIKKYFGPRKCEDGRFVDVYNDKWKSTRSGRELYYADLMRIAQGIDMDSDETKITSAYDAPAGVQVPATGTHDKKVGVGPFAELFAFGLRDYWHDKKYTSKLKRLKKYRGGHKEIGEHDAVVPMSSRHLPASFWSEPKSSEATNFEDSSSEKRVKIMTPSSVINNAKAPDFSDLLDSWTVDQISSCSGSPSPTTVADRET